MWRELRQREAGSIRPSLLAKHACYRRSRSLQLAKRKEIVSAHKSGVNSLQIDAAESRYLLAGASDGSIAIYDTQQATHFDPSSQIAKHEALSTIDRRTNEGHEYAVSSVHWYPIDTGLFVSGSFDRYVKIWDSNLLQVELQFKMPGKVYAVAMSAVASAHMLIATGTEDVRVHLCDMASGAFTHTLSGHRDGVWALQWSASSEWVLVTGGCEGAIRFWDIRRAGCFLVLDQHRTQIGQRSKSASFIHDQAGTSNGMNHMETNSERGSSFLRKRTAHHTSIRRPEAAKLSRQHPGLTVAQGVATAHYGSVTSLQTTYDGFYLFSAGLDSRVRLWDMESGCNTLINYGTTRIAGKKGLQLSFSPDGSLLFVPSDTIIQAYDVWTGNLHATLKGHYDLVNCCSFHPLDQELYSGSNDRQILVWAPPGGTSEDLDPQTQVQADEDNWSD
ncbi:hypothetical protein O6H91_01G057600 [Diphasiastrum complanatum]|uniref:Uncharacterized protein n=1 Tax=Diphasiastrum complanatum TaxID=34168 RepID=A0ACC2ERK3_DIPCM|nr:hypothetical protein O6H91_01G057600 [Diphasiastrum complanatum]